MDLSVFLTKVPPVRDLGDLATFEVATNEVTIPRLQIQCTGLISTTDVAAGIGGAGAASAALFFGAGSPWAVD